jgi:DNA mismatch endonuclease (patch repair protein)
MTDSLSPKHRSWNMARIRSNDTSPEMTVRRMVHALGFRFRLHVATLPGKPDIVLPRLKRIIEIRGCFWHQHPGCIDSHIPKTRVEYWGPKLERNCRRDTANLKALRKLGWKVLTIWECQTARPAQLERRLCAFLA